MMFHQQGIVCVLYLGQIGTQGADTFVPVFGFISVLSFYLSGSGSDYSFRWGRIALASWALYLPCGSLNHIFINCLSWSEPSRLASAPISAV